MRPVFIIAASAGALILSLSMGVRQTLGLLLEPMTLARDWSRGDFALALAVQNLLWGLFTPVAGALADRFGTRRVLLAGGLFYAMGVLLMAFSATPSAFVFSAGVLVGLGVSASGFPLVLAVVGRMVGERQRSLALGMVAAGGSFGQFMLPPFVQATMQVFDWFGALIALAAASAFIVPLALILMRPVVDGPGIVGGQSLRQAVVEASGHSGFRLLTAGFFVCGFHVAFVAVHLPAYLTACGLTPMAGAVALAAIGLFNIAGTLTAGALGGRFSKKYLLSTIYGLRAVVILIFLALPVSEATVMGFAAAFGLLWLSTVPLTSGIVAQVFGPRYVATLFGIVMMSHQVGAFFGAWLGGYIYDLTGGYTGSWLIAGALGLFAMIVHLPIREAPLRQLA